MNAGAVALVTGASSGLGAATVGALRVRGYRTVSLDRRPTDCPVADLTLSADVTDRVSMRAAVEQTLSAFGRLDAVAACAGIFPSSVAPVHLVDVDAWERAIAVNLTGTFNTAQATLPALMTAGGAMVLVASLTAQMPQPGNVAYAAPKAGVTALARAVALEYAAHGVRCCSISPGYIDTPMAAAVLDRAERRASVESGIPAGRVATPEEIAAVIAFALSPAAAYLTGQDLPVDGGMSLTTLVADGEVAKLWRRADATGE